MITQIDMNPMMSIRVPRIDKKLLLDKISKMSYAEVIQTRKDDFSGFLKLRNKHINNGINKIKIQDSKEEEQF